MWVNVLENWVKTSDICRITAVSGHPEFKFYSIFFTSGNSMEISESDYPRVKFLEKMRIRPECYEDF